jgi:hypothetical protein
MKTIEVSIGYSLYNKQNDNTSFCKKSLYFKTDDITKISLSNILANCKEIPIDITDKNIESLNEIDSLQMYFLVTFRHAYIIEL